MPGVTVGVYPGQQEAGTEVSSTYEGRHLTVYEAELTHPYHADTFVDKGEPVVLHDSGVPASYGRAVGVAFKSAAATTDLIALDTEGIWNLTVYAEDDNGNAAIEIGDPLFIRAGTLPGAASGDGTGDAEISKIRDNDVQVPFGYALGSMVAGGSGVIAVKVHWDPSSHSLLDDEMLYFGDALDVSVKWDGDDLEWLPVADDTGMFVLGNGTLNFENFRVYGMTANDMIDYDTSVGLWLVTNTAVGAAARAERHIFTQATPAMTDGVGVEEHDLTISGVGTGMVNANSHWINLGGSSTVNGYMFVHNDGIWDGGTTMTGLWVAWAKFHFLPASDPNWVSWFEGNFSGANSEIDSIFNVNDVALALGYAVGEAGQGVTGTMPFASGAHGTIYYIDVHTASA